MSTRLLLAVCAATTLLFAGCGDDSKDASGPRSVSGTGYTLQRPVGWRDGTKEGRRQGVFNFDLVLLKPKKPFNTNVNILRAKTPGVDIEDLRKGYRGELASIGATGVTDSKPIKLDGDDGITYEYVKKTPGGGDVHGRQVLIVHGGFVHSITLSALEPQFATADTDFDAMLRSWHWG